MEGELPIESAPQPEVVEEQVQEEQPESQPSGELAGIREMLQEALARPAAPQPAPQPQAPDYAAIRVQLSQQGPLGEQLAQYLGDLHDALITQSRNQQQIEQRTRTLNKIPAEYLQRVEEEYAKGRHADMMDAYDTILGRDFREGKAQPRPQPIKRVQTVTRSLQVNQSPQDLNEMPASQFRQIMYRLREGQTQPGDKEVFTRYNSGKLKVLTGQ